MPRDGRDPRLPATGALTRSLALAICLVVVLGCGDLQGLAGECRPAPNESPVPGEAVLRTIPLNQRWAGETARLYWREIRVLEGGFRMIGHFEGQPTWSDPWYPPFFLLGPRSVLVDESGRAYAMSGLSARGPAVIFVDGFLSPTLQIPAKGDILAGVRRLNFEIPNALEQVSGPWSFSVPAQTGPLDAKASAKGRELRLHDLVIGPDSFSVGFMELGSYSPPFVGIRSSYNEFAPARDSRGGTYQVVGLERIGSSPILYMKFAPAPPPDVMLTITLERIFVTTDRTWRETLRLP